MGRPLWSWNSRDNTVKMPVLPKAIHRFKAIPIKLPMQFLKKLKKKNLKFHMKTQKAQETKTILNKKRTVEVFNLKFYLQNFYFFFFTNTFGHLNHLLILKLHLY